jgi:hypothetical protein
MFLPKTILDKLKKRYKPNSVISINNNIKRIFKEALLVKNFDKKLLTSEFETIKKYITGLKKISVQKVMVHNIRSIIGKKHDGYNKLVEIYNKKHRDKTQWAIPTGKKKELYKPLEVLGKKILNFDMSSRGNGVKMLVAGLYKYLPPLRGQDYFNAILSKLPKNVLYEQHYKKLKKNFIDMDNWVLVIGNYKTASKHGIRVIRFTGVLVDIIKKWVKVAGIGNGDWFLVNRMGKKFRQDAFTKMLWRIYGDNFSVDMLRRIYISEMVSYLEELDNPVETIKWRKRLAFIVGHSLESQEFIYSNFKRMKRKKSSRKYMDEIFGYLKAAYVGE